MSIIARRLILAKNLNSFKFTKYFTASLTNLTLKGNNFSDRTLVFSQNSLKKLDHIYLKSNYTTDNAKTEALNNRIKTLLKGDKVVVFIKGTSDQPRCGFSKAVCDILKMHGVSFTSHNILEDEELRSGIKEFSSWPTIPQVFFEGEFIGGCDILLEMHRNGELIEELEKIGIHSKIEESQK